MQGYFYSNGLKIGKIEILSIPGLSENSEKLDAAVSNLKQMKEVDFIQSTEELEQATVNLNSQKEQYAALIGASSETEINSAIQTEKYEVEYLWVKLGNHATKNGITLKMDIARGAASQSKIYNLQFTATGNYANVTEFIYQIENDSTLGFKIENFKLLPSGTSTTNNNQNNTTDNNTTTASTGDVQNLVATFVVKDVYIDLEQISNTSQNSSNTTSNGNTTNQNKVTEDETSENNDEDLDEIANSVQ